MEVETSYAIERIAHKITLRLHDVAGDQEYWRIREIVSEEIREGLENDKEVFGHEYGEGIKLTELVGVM